ncbi:hypothetical protein P4S55_21585 [Shewanella sp. PP-Sp27a-2]
MNINGLDHFTIRTPKLVETLLFYQVILGLKLGWRPQFGFPGHWLYASNKPILHLVEAGDQALDAYLGKAETFMARDVLTICRFVARIYTRCSSIYASRG